MTQLVKPPNKRLQFVDAQFLLLTNSLNLLQQIVSALNGIELPSGVQQQTLGAGINISSGVGSPQGVVPGNIGDLYCSRTGGAGTTLFVKESGVLGSKSGWVSK